MLFTVKVGGESQSLLSANDTESELQLRQRENILVFYALLYMFRFYESSQDDHRRISEIISLIFSQEILDYIAFLSLTTLYQCNYDRKNFQDNRIKEELYTPYAAATKERRVHNRKIIFISFIVKSCFQPTLIVIF